MLKRVFPSITSSPSFVSNPLIFNYLIETCGLSETQAISASNRVRGVKNLQNADTVISLLRNIGLTDSRIRNAVQISPQILFADIDKTLKPKIKFFQELGLTGSDLGLFISKNSTVLSFSLDHRLIPCVEILKKTLSNNRDVIRVLQRCKWILYKDPYSRLLHNISFLQNCGIVGSQLAMLLKRQPTLFVSTETAVGNLIRRVGDMGFSSDSRMFVYALNTISCMTHETLQRKFELFRSFGFSDEDSMLMFRRAPGLLKNSEQKLKLGIEFFVNGLGYDREVLVRRPNFLMYSMEKRVIPRCRVVQLLRSEKLLKKDPSYMFAIQMTEAEFLEKYISRFTDIVEELLFVYKSDVLNSVNG